MGSESHLIQGLLGRAGSADNTDRQATTTVQTDRQYKQTGSTDSASSTARQYRQADRQCRQYRQTGRQCRQTDSAGTADRQTDSSAGRQAVELSSRQLCHRVHALPGGVSAVSAVIPGCCPREGFLPWAGCPASLKALGNSSAGSPGQQEQVGHSLSPCPHRCPPQLGLAGAQHTGAV